MAGPGGASHDLLRVGPGDFSPKGTTQGPRTHTHMHTCARTYTYVYARMCLRTFLPRPRACSRPHARSLAVCSGDPSSLPPCGRALRAERALTCFPLILVDARVVSSLHPFSQQMFFIRSLTGSDCPFDNVAAPAPGPTPCSQSATSCLSLPAGVVLSSGCCKIQAAQGSWSDRVRRRRETQNLPLKRTLKGPFLSLSVREPKTG